MDTTLNLTVTPEPVKDTKINLPKVVTWYPPMPDERNPWKYVALVLLLVILLMWWK